MIKYFDSFLTFLSNQNFMSRTLPQPLILSIFQNVKTFVPHKGHMDGIFIVGMEGGFFFFKWIQNRDISPQQTLLQPTNVNQESQVIRQISGLSHQIYLTSSRIQKIIVTPHEPISDILISTFHPPEMQQFQFTVNPIPSCIQFLQLLAINSSIIKTSSSGSDFWRMTVTNNATMYSMLENIAKIYDITCTDGLFQVPYLQVFKSVESIPLVDELSNTQISSRFNIQSAIFTESPLDHDFYRHFLSSSANFSDFCLQASRRGIDPNMRHFIWPQLLHVLPFEANPSKFIEIRTREYETAKKQWLSLSSYQLAKHPELRSAYQTIRMDVRRTNVPADFDEQKIKTVLTNILRTYAIWCFDVRYTQGLNDVLLPFVIIFERSEYPQEVKEALSFWCFAAFIEAIDSALIDKNMDGIMQKDLPLILELVGKYDKPCAQWIENCNLSDMNFFVSPYMLAFRRSLSPNDLERAWDTIMASSNPSHSIICFAVALIIFAFPSFSKIQNCSLPVLLPLCDKILAKSPIGPVIGVSLVIAGNEKPREKKSHFHTKDVFYTDFYTPNMTDEFKECIASNLFV